MKKRPYASPEWDAKLFSWQDIICESNLKTSEYGDENGEWN